MSDEPWRKALQNIKKLARSATVERYKAKKAPPKEAPKPKEKEPEIETEADDEGESGEPEANEKTELIVMAGRKPKDKPGTPSGGFAPPKKRGRPPKQK